jgi:hypothetical protein
MPCRTLQNTINFLVRNFPLPILTSSPRRKAFMLSPIAVGSGGSAIIAAVFGGSSSAQIWTVPVGVISVLDMYAWGCGGAGGESEDFGGGGGGGGGFCSTGPLTVVPGQQYRIVVGQASSPANTTIQNPSLAPIATSGVGGAASADVGGTPGAGSGGVYNGIGGNGATATGYPAGDGGGGGGAAGSFAPGGDGGDLTAGVGGGTATQLTYGQGGDGGAGALVSVAGNDGAIPGGGGGGAGQNGAPAGNGADGLVVIFYQVGSTGGPISLSHRKDVLPGIGILNYLPGATFPTLICDDDIGHIITDEWWIVSGTDGVPVQITEYLYECDPEYAD